MTGRVHSIDSFATLDGGGIRFAIFLQGCPLHCIYCHNPDTQAIIKTYGKKKAFEQMSGGEMASGDVSAMRNGRGSVVEISGEIELCGQAMTADELVEKIYRKKEFYRDGGVTISGGEPLMQSNFCLEIIQKVHKRCGLHVAIDTSGGVLPGNIVELIAVADMFILDIKYATDEEYLEYTGSDISNTTALLRMLSTANKRTIIRSVIMESVNDSEDYIDKYLNIVRGCGNIVEYQLLGYHRLGVYKYAELGLDYALRGMQNMNEERLAQLQKYLDDRLYDATTYAQELR